jgi:GT2 family glycosyltransferase
MKTAAVVVTYNPDAGVVDRIKSIERQCDVVYVIDNGSDPQTLDRLKKTKATVVALGENTGIAHAQNVGLKMAFEKKTDGVILFDQDSQPQANFVENMWNTVSVVQARTGRPPIVGANIFDTNKKSFSRYPVSQFMWFRRRLCSEDSNLSNVMMVIASGTLIVRDVFEKCGLMNRAMFIDYVDWEYCLRARSLQFDIVICGAAILHHRRGERRGVRLGPVTLYPLGYNAFRYYQIFRNRILVFKRYCFREPGYLFFEVLSFSHEFFLLFLEKNCSKNLLAALKGIRDGICKSLSQMEGDGFHMGKKLLLHTRQELGKLIAAKLKKDRKRLSSQWAGSGPIRHFVLDNLLPESITNEIYKRFPMAAEMMLKKSLREQKRVAAQMNKYDPMLEEIIYAFQEPAVVREITAITKLSDLRPDPNLYAGGISLMQKNDFLNPHLDNSHDKDRSLYRVLNLLYYVTPDWPQNQGGNLELWQNGPKGNPTEIWSRYNRLVVMLTNRHSWHSVNPIRSSLPRCCVSNYYFSPFPADEREYFHVTSFRGRPEQKLRDLILQADNCLRMFIRKIFPLGIRENPHVYKK